MKKALKYAIGVFLAFLSLFIALSMGALVLFNTQAVKAWLETSLTQTTGRQVALDGNMSLSLFPEAELSLEEVRLSNPEGFSDSDMLRIKNATARVALWPLVTKKELVLKKLFLTGMELELEKNKDGQENWKGFPQTSGQDHQEGYQGGKGRAVLKVKRLGELDIRKSHITYKNKSSGAALMITDLDIKRTHGGPGFSIGFDMEAGKLSNGPFFRAQRKAGAQRPGPSGHPGNDPFR